MSRLRWIWSVYRIWHDNCACSSISGFHMCCDRNGGAIMVTPKCESLKTTIAYYEQHGKTVEAGVVLKMLDGCEEANETVSSLPPIWIRGMNFASAMASHAVDGFRRCDQAEIDSRLAICQQCPQFVNNHCNLCGCACVEENRLTNKLALKSSTCPQGKW